MDDATWGGLLGRIRTWQAQDPDPAARAELDALVSVADGTDRGAAARAGARADLADRFAGTLQFGTAGLRGRLGAGPNRMNRAVVIRAAAGLARYLQDRVEAPAVVVVGYDARTDSDVFAADTCAVLTGAGLRAMVLPGPLPTPVLAFAVLYLRADAGVMVTASHNPARDNGYKVYLGGRADPSPGRGAQIVPPADAQIAAAIQDAGPACDVPRPATGWTTLGGQVREAYLAAVALIVAGGGPRELSVVLTPLHGVGGDTAVAALTVAGFPAPYVVPEQAAPDPAFPTVAFPNPEEPGALDLALAAARRRGADLVIATDPDADRCAVAVPDPAAEPGPDARPSWRVLRGDELGALLGEHLLTRRPPGERDVVACSIVSSELLSRIAADHRVAHTQTLTGFKWIARVPGLVYGYEEALGYCVAPHVVRDKDGVGAALLVAELAAALRADGRTLLDLLDDLARRHGVHATDQLAVRVDHLDQVGAAMTGLRREPPRTLAGQRVSSIDDLADGGAGLPPTDALRYRTTGGLRVLVRPSGTEPKLKCYLEAVLPVGTDGDLATPRARAGRLLAGARADLQARLGLLPAARRQG